VADGLVSIDPALAVGAIGLGVFAREQNGAAGEPGFQAFREERFLPSSVRGPVESWALAWFAATCWTVDMVKTPFVIEKSRGKRPAYWQESSRHPDKQSVAGGFGEKYVSC
jgi:hypothetical protein